MSNRLYFYSAKYRVSIGMDITEEGEIIVAAAFCKYVDEFVKSSKHRNGPTARSVLDGRFDKLYSYIKSGKTPGPDNTFQNFIWRFSNVYKGNKPSRDVWYPFLKEFREEVLDCWEYNPDGRQVETIREDIDDLCRTFVPGEQESDIEQIAELVG